MKVSEMTGAELDYWVAMAEGMKPFGGWKSFRGPGVMVGCLADIRSFAPSTNWTHGGPIIEREKIDLEYRPRFKKWLAILPPSEEALFREWGGDGACSRHARLRRQQVWNNCPQRGVNQCLNSKTQQTSSMRSTSAS